MIDMRKLNDELRDLFIEYQWRLDCPFPQAIPEDSLSVIIKPSEHLYRTNPLFHSKVEAMVAGVMHVVRKADELEGKP